MNNALAMMMVVCSPICCAENPSSKLPIGVSPRNDTLYSDIMRPRNSLLEYTCIMVFDEANCEIIPKPEMASAM